MCFGRIDLRHLIMADSPIDPVADALEQCADDVVRYFRFSHLPAHLAERSRPFAELALHIVESTPQNAQRAMAINHLLIAKDAAVRAGLKL